MSSLYPSLEDMKVDHIMKAQGASMPAPPSYQPAVNYPQAPPSNNSNLYPALVEYMGMSSNEMNMQLANIPSMQVAQVTSGGAMQLYTAPVSGLNNAGLIRAQVKQGIREVVLCKDQQGKIGLRVQAVNKGVFVSFVHNGSAAALGGLRFGDQILQINSENVAGWDTDKTMKFIRKSRPERIAFAVRDRPFERTITMQKDSLGHVGFIFKDNKITDICKDSSAARNGVLTEHHLVEVNGQNIVGMKEKEIKAVFEKSAQTVTITIIPSFVYEHIMKNIASGLVKKSMDHSISDL